MKFEKGQTVICNIDVYRDGNTQEYDGYITHVFDDGVDVCYLEGYHSRNDKVLFKNIVALVDKTLQCPEYKTKSFTGHLIPNL